MEMVNIWSSLQALQQDIHLNHDVLLDVSISDADDIAEEVEAEYVAVPQIISKLHPGRKPQQLLNKLAKKDLMIIELERFESFLNQEEPFLLERFKSFEIPSTEPLLKESLNLYQVIDGLIAYRWKLKSTVIKTFTLLSATSKVSE